MDPSVRVGLAEEAARGARLALQTRAPWWEHNLRYLLPLPTLLLLLLFVVYPTITAIQFAG